MKTKSDRVFEGLAWLVLPVVGLFFHFTRPLALVLLVTYGVVLVLVMWFGVLNAQERRGTLEGAKDKIRALVTTHLDTLARKRLIGITEDAYGVIDASKWNDEAKYFMEHVVWPTL